MNDKKPIPGFEGKYWITLDGKVFNKDGHQLKPARTKNGVPHIELRKDGQRELIPVEVLIAIAWR